jgi:molybdopterin-guanine dinucleotide biosynthesis protein A
LTIGVVLAGGAGRRMGGAKATAALAGRPLAAWAVDALREAGLAEVVVVAKADTPLPALDVPVWDDEPPEPRHPLAGVRHALARAGGADVLTLPVDLPLVPPALLRELAAATGLAIVRGHPLLARWPAGTVVEPAGRVTDAVLALGPVVVEGPATGLANVNTPIDLAAAERHALPRRRER